MYGAAGFIGMRAVSEPAVTTDTEDLPEIMTHFFTLKINCAEAFDTRRIYNCTIGKKVHLGEGGGVHTFVVGVGDLAGTGHLLAEERVEKGGFAYS